MRSVIARFVRLISMLLIGSMLAGMIVSCTDDPVEETPTATRVRPTRTPAKPTAMPEQPSNANQAASSQAEWTILVYLDGDNDLEDAAVDDFNEMASVGSTAALNIVVQFDRIGSDEDWDNAAHGDWQGVKRFLVEKNKRPAKSNQLADLGELNMGDPQTVVDFVTWGVETYPAKQYALIFWDHGSAWPGIASDDTSDGDMLTLPELREAFKQIQQQTGVQKFDLIGFDACLMGQIDVLQAIAPYGNVAIGSADLEPGEGWAWNAWLADLAKKPQLDEVAIAPSIIKSFTAFYENRDEPSVTLSAFDLNDIEQMSAQLDTLAGLMIERMPSAYKAIAKSRSYAAEYASGDEDISAVDLGNFADSLANANTDPEVATAARNLSKLIKAARIYQDNGSDHPKSSGITVYFPKKKKHYDKSYADGSPLANDTQWDEFLQAFYKGAKPSARSTITTAKLSQPTARPNLHTLSATIAGDDTAYVYSVVGIANPSNPDAIQILTVDYLYPPGSALAGEFPNWQNGDSIEFNWRASVWYLSNGNETVLAPVTPIDYGSNVYAIDGVYTFARSGSQVPVSIEFEVIQDQGVVQHIWAFDDTSSSHTRARELTPKPGDRFTPDILTYVAQADDVEEQTNPGRPITIGEQPLRLFESNAPGGDYLLGVLIEDTAGQFSDQYLDLTIDGPDANIPPVIPDLAAIFGSSSGPQSYQDADLGFALEYPDGWDLATPGVDKFTFSNPSDPTMGEVVVDVYAIEGTIAESNSSMLDLVLEEASEQFGYELIGQSSPVEVAGQTALQIEYAYEQQDDSQIHVVAIAVSSEETGATYLITYAAPEEGFADHRAIFEQILATFTIG
ncbi:MAG: clostripain-related cysteine peptidase [Roseiflexaceae bacterium]